MHLCGLILVLVRVFCAPVSSSELVTAVEYGTYPPWTYYRNATCQCGSIEHGISVVYIHVMCVLQSPIVVYAHE